MNIDRIAREMVDIEPSTDLEARIRARIRTTAQTERANRWWLWRVAMPVAVAALLTMTVVLRRPSSKVEGPAVTTAPVQAAQITAPAPSRNASTVPRQEASVVRVAKRSRESRTVTAELSAEELAWMERRMQALVPATALHVDHLHVDSIQPEPLAITPLIMPPVTTEGSGIERRNDR